MHVAITGASSGIGEGLARRYLERGARVTLVARRRELLEKIAQGHTGQMHLACVDLSEPVHATSWVDEAEAALGSIDVLVNNAGQQIVEPFVATEWERAERMLRLDLLTPLRLSQYVARRMMTSFLAA